MMPLHGQLAMTRRADSRGFGWPESYQMAAVAPARQCDFPKLHRNFN